MPKKKLGFGLMRLPMIGDEIDYEQVNQMVDEFLAKGFTYFDSAYVYIGGKSEVAIKKCIVERHPRDSFTIATKLPVWEVHSKEDVDRIFNEQLERTGAGYFDYYLLHAVDGTRLDAYGADYGIWEYCQQKKKEGLIKNLGFSFHDTADVLEDALSRFPADFVQLQINYNDWDDPVVQSGKCYEVCAKRNIPVVVMEPVKGGSLAQFHPDIEQIYKAANPDVSIASWAIRFVASLPDVMVVLSGMSTLGQMDDNSQYMENFVPLNESEKATINEALTAMKKIPTIPCTACRYCVDGCPMQIVIPDVFKAMNFNTIYQDKAGAKWRYDRSTENGHGKASDCIHCLQCEGACPQHLEITSLLEKAAADFE